MMLMLLSAMVMTWSAKPTVPLEESCRKASAVLVVEPAVDAGTYKVVEVLHDGTGDALKKEAVVAVDLKGMVYEKGRAYILFIKPASEPKHYEAVEQARTEDGKDVRERVRRLLAALKGK